LDTVNGVSLVQDAFTSLECYTLASALQGAEDMPYSPLMIRPMREEVTRIGFVELDTPEAVDTALASAGTVLLFFNSVCGIEGPMARSGLRMALEHKVKPDKLYSVFAGQDLEGTARTRALIPDIPPSSPSIALFKDRELVHFLPRHRIEARKADGVSSDLIAAFDEYCAPSSPG
jgi:putative YphP/YqiW family bacilliredoxin